MGAAYGTAKAGIGITGMGTQRPELIMKVGSRWTTATDQRSQQLILNIALVINSSRVSIRMTGLQQNSPLLTVTSCPNLQHGGYHCSLRIGS